MNKRLFHWIAVISSIVLLAGCTNGGSSPDEIERDPVFDPLPAGLPVFSEINEPYLNTSSSGDSLSLFSYTSQDSATTSPTETEVFSASADVLVALNTAADDVGETEYTLIARNDSVYLVNHRNNEIRLLSHFINQICELIPTETVLSTPAEPTTEKQLTVLHKELIYVMTTEQSTGNTQIDDCQSDAKKRFYALPLDHQLDPSLDEDGVLDSLELVSESEARAKLLFGWKADPDNVSQQVLEYGYLGFDSEGQTLSLFDQALERVWTQERQLQRFEQVAIGSDTLSDQYIFHVEALENQQYLIQLGLDVFVIDAGDLLSKGFDEIDSVLSDKTLTADIRVQNVENAQDLFYAVPVKAFFDADDLLIVDNNKIYRLDYQRDVPPRNPTITTSLVPQNPTSFDHKDYLSSASFSQFDLSLCDDDDLECESANDVEASTWQFLTPCEAQFGCTNEVSTNDFCETREEKLLSQSDRLLCSPSQYEHLAELNNTNNDAELIAFMQYVDTYVRQTDFLLHNNRLFITAKMNQKDVFLAYDFNQDFSAAKILREQVLFGERAALTGMSAVFAGDNLFLTALQKGALRSNECYKNGLRVLCELFELTDSGGGISCTGKDFAEKLCTNQFSEYESKAIFCSAAQIADLTCSDAVLSQLDSLTAEDASEDAKWLPIYDYATNDHIMYLLAGDHAEALRTGNLDEGKLFEPSVFSVDTATGQKDQTIASMAGTVETVVGGWLSKEPGLDVAEVYGRVDVLEEDINQTSGIQSVAQSKLSTYLLEQTFENRLSTESNFKKATKVAERLFDRFQP